MQRCLKMLEQSEAVQCPRCPCSASGLPAEDSQSLCEPLKAQEACLSFWMKRSRKAGPPQPRACRAWKQLGHRLIALPARLIS